MTDMIAICSNEKHYNVVHDFNWSIIRGVRYAVGL